MTILVDDSIQYPEHMVSEEAKRRGHGRKAWSHLTSDLNEEELHEFATRLGMRREWFQGDHYDLTEGKQKQALRLGAKAVTSEDLFRRSCFNRFKAFGIDLCPICGKEISITGETKDGKLIGSCGDAFTREQWNWTDENSDYEEDAV